MQINIIEKKNILIFSKNLYLRSLVALIYNSIGSLFIICTLGIFPLMLLIIDINKKQKENWLTSDSFWRRLFSFNFHSLIGYIFTSITFFIFPLVYWLLNREKESKNDLEYNDWLKSDSFLKKSFATYFHSILLLFIIGFIAVITGIVVTALDLSSV